METALEIFIIVLPIIIAGTISLFVINRLKAKQQRGTLCKKETTQAQTLLDSMIPLGMVFGSALGLLFGMIFPVSLPTAIALGAAFGLLIGYFAYENYSKEREGQS